MQDEFEQVPGVLSTEVGYTGGFSDHPTYEQVCSGSTGHTEAVRVFFDPRKLTYKALIKTFLTNHSPSFDLSFVRGGQYSTVIFCVDPLQQAVAKEVIASTESASHRKLSVAVRQAGQFWKAEEYHQHYYRKKGLGTCAIH